MISLFGCNPDHTTDTMRISKVCDSDRFSNTMVESRFFTIYTGEANTITTGKGNLLIIPSGSLLDTNGDIVDDSVIVEFAEATELDEIILSNLTIQDSSFIYESYLSFYFNATRNGKQLQINPDNPIYFELTADRQVSLYKGIRDKYGDMKWIKEKDAVDYLIPVSLEMLDFYPLGFESEVEKGLPYRSHEIVTSDFLDSLYYSFAAELDQTRFYILSSRFNMISLNIPVLSLFARGEPATERQELDTLRRASFCGINPASIKAIRQRKFQNTLISTREFESRLRCIFATCDDRILELYVNNLNRNLWEIDEMAAGLLDSSNAQYDQFIEFASYRQTTVKLSDEKAELLSQHYKRDKEHIERELQRKKSEFLQKAKKQEEVAEQTKAEYQDLLKARRTYRMQKFGFELTSFGWYNAAHEIRLSEVEKFNLNIKIGNGNQYDRVYSYVVNPKVRSIFSYLSDDNENFNIVYSDDPDLLLWKDQKFTIVAVGYMEKKIGYRIGEYIQRPRLDAILSLEAKDINTFRKDVKKLEKGYLTENKIMVDLAYQEFFYKEKKRKEKDSEEAAFLYNLLTKVFPCCEHYAW